MDRITLPDDLIQDLCERWHIKTLELFGSALRDDFNAESDIDLLVTFQPEVTPTLWDLLAIREALADIFHRDVDLGLKSSVEDDPNYIRRKNILSSAQVIYES